MGGGVGAEPRGQGLGGSAEAVKFSVTQWCFAVSASAWSEN